MEIEPTQLSDLAYSSILACVVLETHGGLISAANGPAHALLEVDTLVGTDFALFLGGQLPELIVFTGSVDYLGENWTRDLELVASSGRKINVELHGRLIDHGGSSYLQLQIIDLDAFTVRAEATATSNLHAKGLMEWNRARAFFAEMEDKNRLILDAAGEGIYGINLEGKATFVNNAAKEMLGWTEEDLLGKNIHEMIHHHHIDGDPYHARDCPIYHSFRNEQVNRVEDEVFWHKAGKPIEVAYTSTPIYDQQVLAGAVVIFRDISARMENERKLHSAMTQIEALSERLEQENEYLQEEIQSVRSHFELIGASPAIARTVAQIDLAAPTDTNVLITGEGGTGKALIASEIHKSSQRAKRPIISINCSAIPPATFESELFGHVRGAFAGALHDRTGKLELANGGTLFLDEVSAIPIQLQGKILRSLQEQVSERLGASRPNKINVRVIASTSVDLVDCVKHGSFREDLYFYLNVFPIECHPLRERKSDIPELAQHFVKLACERLNLDEPTITKANVRDLKAYHWPGNVRELQNVIERGVILARGSKLVLDLQNIAMSATVAPDQEILTEIQLNELQVQNILACLKQTKGRVAGESGAANLLGVKPTTLYSRIRKFGITLKDTLD